MPQSAISQIVPDNTLGEFEQSTVNRAIIRGLPASQIEGGAIRDGNLFHSFQEFSIDAGQAAYFSNPDDIERIFSRVTGERASALLGRLGVLGEADLFFLNPNGILFGPGASLDLEGSFIGTTADGIEFGEAGIFSTINPQTPSRLLSVSPSVMLFSSKSRPGGIINQSTAPIVPDPSGFGLSGLSVAEGESLLLVGGDITMSQNGRVSVLGGRVELGGLASAGSVGITETQPDSNGESSPSLLFPEDAELADILLSDSSGVRVFSTNREGAIAIRANTFTALSGGRLETITTTPQRGGNIDIRARSITLEEVGQFRDDATIRTQSRSEGAGGDIQIDADTIALNNGGSIITLASSSGDAGDISVSADNSITASGPDRRRIWFSTISSDALSGASGNSGNIDVSSRILRFEEGANITTSTFGAGSGGNIQIDASEQATFSGIFIEPGVFPSQSGLQAIALGSGQAGSITFQGDRLQIDRGAAISAAALGAGNAGDVVIQADSVAVLGIDDSRQISSTINSDTSARSTGNGGDVTVNARVLQVKDGADISTNTFGSGRGGLLQITVRERAELVGSVTNAQGGSAISRITASTQGLGEAGNLQFNGGDLRVEGGATIATDTFGEQAAGDISIVADEIVLAGLDRARTRASGISGETDSASSGKGGNVTVNARRLSIRDGATISVSTFGSGDGGDLQVEVSDRTLLSGIGITAQGQIGASGLFATTQGTGAAGSLAFRGSQLQIESGAGVSATTAGPGDAGNVTVEADSIDIVGTALEGQGASSISSEVIPGAAGDGGDITINTRTLRLREGGAISVSTFGQGSAGNIAIVAEGAISLLGSHSSGSNSANSRIDSSISPGAVGNAGDIDIAAQSLAVTDGAQILAAVVGESTDFQGNPISGGRGDAGSIRVEIEENLRLFGVDVDGFPSGILTLSGRGALGAAGEVAVRADSVQIEDGAVIESSTFNSGESGDVMIRARELSLREGGQIITNTRSSSNAGEVSLKIEDTFEIVGFDTDFDDRLDSAAAFIRSQDNETLQVSDVVGNQGNRSGVFASTEAGSTGTGGSIVVEAGKVRMSDRAQLSTQSEGRGGAGRIQVSARESVVLSDRAQISTTTQQPDALAGDIAIAAQTLFSATDSDLVTSAANASGGNISVAADNIQLLGDSDIRTNSDRDGGNILLSAASIIAVDDSDIFASAAQGRGGNITLATPVFFGDGYTPEAVDSREVETQLENNNRVDLNATGQVSSGTISTPAETFIQDDLAELSTNLVSPDTLVASSCIARRERTNTFTISSISAVAEDPQAARSAYPTGAVRVEVAADNRREGAWQLGDPIVEPQDVYQLSNGRVVLSQTCPDPK